MSDNQFLRAKAKGGQEVLVDQRKPAFATHINLKSVGGAPVLEFFCLDVIPQGDHDDDDIEIDLDESEVEPIARIALSPSALDQLEELLIDLAGPEEEEGCGCGCDHGHC